jgi:predicted permease
VEALLKDTRDALRALLRRPGFTIAALLTLAVGIGANAAVFTMVDALMLAPLPFGDRSDRVVSLHSTHPTQPQDWEDSRVSFADYEDVRAASRLLEDVGAYVSRGFTLTADGQAERIQGGSVTPNLFPLLRAQPLLGRQFLPEEAAQPGFEPVVMLSHGLWQRRFGGDPGIVGRAIHVNQRALTVIGVMPEGFRFPERDQLWLPYGRDDGPRDRRFLIAVGVLRPGVTVAQLQDELDGLAATLAQRHPDTNRAWGLHALPYRELLFDQGGRLAVGSLMAAVAFVLVIGCANLANLLLARGVSRQREIAVRTAVGASRGRIVRLVLLESLLLAAAGAALGAWLGEAALRATVASWPEELPYWIRFQMSGRVVAFLAFVSLLTASAFGLLPALRLSRPDLVSALKEEGRTTGSSGDRRLQSWLVAGQVALCLALLVGANLMIRSFLEMQAADAGFDESGMVSLRVPLAGDGYDPLPARVAFFRRVAERLTALPGVAAAAATSSIPADDGGAPVRIVADGKPVAPGDEIGALRITIQPRLFEALGVRLQEGRAFTEREEEDPAAEVAIVNRTLAQRLWPAEGAIGRRVGLVEATRTRWLTIVGVAPEVQYEEFGEQTSQSVLHVYVPYAHVAPRVMALLVRGPGPAAALVAPIRRAMAETAPDVAVYDLRTMPERRRETTWEQRFFGQAMGVFAGVALFLACVGVYGVLSYAVSRRTREIGVRMALGATAPDVLRLVLGQAARMAAAGIGVGLLLALALARLLRGILYGVGSADPWALGGMAALLAMVVLAAGGLPARLAARTDPLRALREE